MKPNLSTEFSSSLESGERLLWTGIPKQGILFRKSDLIVIPFSIFWCGFAFFWMYMAAQGGGFFFLFGIPFVFIGLIMVFGRFIIDAMMRKNTIYGLTEERLIIKSGVFSISTRSVALNAITESELIEHANGLGTVLIGPKPYGRGQMPAGMEWWPGAATQQVRIEQVKQARKLYQQIRNLQRKNEIPER